MVGNYVVQIILFLACLWIACRVFKDEKKSGSRKLNDSRFDLAEESEAIKESNQLKK